jgi:Tfp pilus assembly protein PilF
MDYQPGTVKQLGTHIKTMKEEGVFTALLLGAGVSKTAGIPLAGEMVQELIKKYPDHGLKQHEEKSNAYNEVMKALTHNQRESFLKEKIQNGKINLAHFFIGSLVSNGYVDCILTTNFDPLLVKTLALFNIYPSIYDLANTRKFLTSSIAFPNIFYLHGQGTGFRMLNTEDETKESTEYFTRLFEQLDRKHTWIVAGYGGETDFIFKGLTEQDNFYNNLYWVGRAPEPAAHVQSKLCCKDSVRYLSSLGADSFFRDLNNELGLPLPSFVDKPFSHLKGLLQNIGELKFEQDTQVLASDFLNQTYLKIDAAVTTIEADDRKALTKAEVEKMKSGDVAQKISELFALGKYKEIIERHEEIISSDNAEATDSLVWAYIEEGGLSIDAGSIEEGNSLYAEAVKVKSDFYGAWNNWGIDLGKLAASKGHDEKLYGQAFEKYAEAVKVKPDKHEAWNNWGYGLGNLAASKGHDEKLYGQAFEKYAEAVKVKPGFHEAWNNWGSDLSELAASKGHDEKLYGQAFEKYAEAVKVKPEKHEAWYNWGSDLSELAASKGHDEKLYGQAFEKYAEAVKVKPGSHEAWHNWGSALSELAASKGHDEKLYGQAFEKYAEAVKVKPDKHEAWNNWGTSLGKLAASKGHDEKLYGQAFEKYAEAVKVKPDKHEAWYNWGSDLSELAASKGHDEKLYGQAFEKYAEAVKVKPDKHEAWYNWGTSLGKLAASKAHDEKLYGQAFEKYAEAVKVKPDFHEAWYNWGSDLSELAASKGHDEKLYGQAFEKYAEAVKVKPDFHEAWYNWGITLGKLATAKANDEKLFGQAFEKYAEAVKIKPDKHEAWNNWGVHLGYMASSKGNDEKLFGQAFEKYAEANRYSPHSASYNMACTYSILNEKEKALKFLEESLAAKSSEMSRKEIEDDVDMQNIRGLQEFNEILNKYFPQK